MGVNCLNSSFGAPLPDVQNVFTKKLWFSSSFESSYYRYRTFHKEFVLDVGLLKANFTPYKINYTVGTTTFTNTNKTRIHNTAEKRQKISRQNCVTGRIRWSSALPPWTCKTVREKFVSDVRGTSCRDSKHTNCWSTRYVGKRVWK